MPNIVKKLLAAVWFGGLVFVVLARAVAFLVTQTMCEGTHLVGKAWKALKS